jgi:hypothetical protein
MTIAELSDTQLIAKYHAMNAALVERQKASKHTKFDKQAFPPPGDIFMAFKNEIDAEIKKRNLWI